MIRLQIEEKIYILIFLIVFAVMLRSILFHLEQRERAVRIEPLTTGVALRPVWVDPVPALAGDMATPGKFAADKERHP